MSVVLGLGLAAKGVLRTWRVSHLRSKRRMGYGAVVAAAALVVAAVAVEMAGPKEAPVHLA